MKYPRTYHLPNSPGSTNDDKKLINCDEFLNSKERKINLIFTEKLDGSNACLTSNNVFSRSHNQTATHSSFDYLKQIHSKIKHNISPDEQIFGEYCFAIHSITYQKLPDYFFIIGIRKKDQWLSFDETKEYSMKLDLNTIPVLFEGSFSKEKDLLNKVENLSKGPSVFGGDKEGIVVRIKDSFSNNDFSKSIAKYVRKDHVKTDEHWMFQSLKKQNKI